MSEDQLRERVRLQYEEVGGYREDWSEGLSWMIFSGW